MTFEKLLPFWYCGVYGNIRNVTCSIGHLTQKGFIFPKYKYYEYKKD